MNDLDKEIILIKEKKNGLEKPSLLSEIFAKNGLENEIEGFTNEALSKIKFSLIIKPAIISAVALFISFFLDLSSVPFLGNISISIAKSIFPAWQPAQSDFTPFSFWWLPILTYLFFIFLAKLSYDKLKMEVLRTPASETIDRVINSYTSIIDSISTALPLIGAAILLISIRLGETVFLGLSVPFEIKALIILALGKLFEPVLDQLGVEFQNVVNHVKDLKERYFSRIQLENSKNLVNRINHQDAFPAPSISVDSISIVENFNSALENTVNLSNSLSKNFFSLNQLIEKINISEAVNSEKLNQLKIIAESISKAAASLNDERTVTGLKYLESIVIKR